MYSCVLAGTSLAMVATTSRSQLAHIPAQFVTCERLRSKHALEEYINVSLESYKRATSNRCLIDRCEACCRDARAYSSSPGRRLPWPSFLACGWGRILSAGVPASQSQVMLESPEHMPCPLDLHPSCYPMCKLGGPCPWMDMPHHAPP